MAYAQPQDPLCAVASPKELLWLEAMCKRNGYLSPTPMGDGQYLVLHRLMFHWTMIRGTMFDDWGYEDRWCYADLKKASAGLVDWWSRGFEGEPTGWHRHPDTGRRRPDGDPSQEYIDP
jgi:hypothetical protein